VTACHEATRKRLHMQDDATVGRLEDVQDPQAADSTLARSMPRVSVLVAAYNAEDYLREALASVSAQTYDDWEVVVADDGSTDATAVIAEGAGGRVRLVRSAGNEGPGPARNLAARHAGGELFATLDADDLWEPGYLARKLEAYDAARARGEAVAVVGCDASLLGPDGYDALTYLDYVGRVPRPGVAALLRANCVYNSILVEASVFAAAGGYTGELRSSEDHDLLLRIAEAGHGILVIEEPLAVYRVRASSASDHSATLAQTTRMVFERAIARGALTPAQRIIARRSIRLYRVLERRAVDAEARTRGERNHAHRLGTLALAARVAAEHPERWLHWLRRLAGRARPNPRSAVLGRH
jgi:glycosyltransferase involved in cell wall biosynthesis